MRNLFSLLKEDPGGSLTSYPGRNLLFTQPEPGTEYLNFIRNFYQVN